MAFFSSAEIPCTAGTIDAPMRPQHGSAQQHHQIQQQQQQQQQPQLQQPDETPTSSQMSVEQETEKLNAFLFNPFWKRPSAQPTGAQSQPQHQQAHPAAAPAQLPKPAVVAKPVPSAAKMLTALANNPRERYALHKRLRHSIYGEVYMGTDRMTGQRVAVKVSVLELLREHTSRNGIGVLEDPVHEAELMRKISGHPHVVQLVATHEDKQLHWMVQEFIGGGELFELLVKHGHFNERVSHHFFLCLLAGLQHIHRSGVCHLDLSLENLLVDERGFVKICDFGLARLLPAEGKPFVGADDNKPGKVNYMAPEVFAGKDFWGCSADLFSCGVILFTMLTGHPPFENASKQDERYKLIAEGKIDKLLAALRMTNRVPVAAMDLLTRLMHPDPRHRLKTVEDVAVHPWIKAGGNSQASSSSAAASAGQRH